MSDERDQSAQTKEALEHKIQQLTQEINLLQIRLSETNPLPPAKIKTANFGLIKNSWLISFGQYLLLEPDKNCINSALARLGQLFELKSCSLWRLNSRSADLHHITASHYHCMEQWRSEPNVTIREAAWLQAILESDKSRSVSLNKGKPVVFSASQEPEIFEPLGSTHIVSSLLVPLIRANHIEGLMLLHSSESNNWHARDLERLSFIAHALFGVNDRQKLMRQLSNRDTRFNYAIEASSDGLWDWNITSGRIYFSRNYLRMLGYNYESLPGNLTTLQSYFLHTDDIDMVMAHYQAAIEKGKTHINFQFRMQHQNGKILWIQSKTKFCEPDENGRATRCVGLNTDISAFVNAHEELLAAKTHADMANQTKSEFLARISHEIRTPMNAIIGLGYLLKDTTLDEQQKSYLNSLNSASDSLLYIINEVLDFSKIETGKIILEQANFDLDNIFEKISRLFEINATHKIIRIIYDIKADVPRFLRGDAIRLSQVIGHLINNALQHSGTSEVVVSVNLQQTNSNNVELEFSVRDFGTGMSEKRLAKVNESLLKHVRIKDEDRNRFGLGICSHLITLMGGTLEVKSELGKGCCVTFNAQFEHSHLGSKKLPTHSRDLSNVRALIVDDNIIARTVIASTAKNIGLAIDTAEDAEQAMEKINDANTNEKPFHIVLMDYRMPAMNGIEAATAIKANKQLSYSPHIIIISAYHREEILNAINIALPVDEFLNKPVSETRLFDAINEVISNDKNLQEISSLRINVSEQDALLNNLHVLVAEDNVVNQQVVRGVLKKKGIRVTVANNGIEALHELQNSNEYFDLILMDLEMPEMDGIVATQEIRKGNCHPDIPIIALTAQAMRGDRESCLAAGMNAYLSKPINPELMYRTMADQASLVLVKKHE